MTAVTADPHAWPEARKLLGWLRGLATRRERRVVIGQQIESYGNPRYGEFIDTITATTGRTPAMVGMGVHSGWDDRNFPSLLRHWERGGLITLEWHPSDPWRAGGYDTAWVARGPGAVDDSSPKPDLSQLLSGARETPAYRKYWQQLTQLGDIIEALGEEGVVVILRPLHEANGAWFWWGQDKNLPSGQDPAAPRTDVIALYHDLFQYLREQRHLHNVLYTYSPAPSWDGHVLTYYPGDGYVDLVGPTRYDDTLRLLGPEIPGEENHDDWQALSRLGKPIGYGEFAPARSDGGWDARTLLRTIREHYPGMVMAHCWHGWKDGTRRIKKELAAQRHITELMNDKAVVCLENLDWRR